MPRTNRKPARADWRAAWDAREPAVNVPPAEVAGKVAELLDVRAEALRPKFLGYVAPTREELAEVHLTAQQALVVALDTAVRAGLDHESVTFRQVVDQLAERWSPSFRAADPATTVYDMKLETVERVRWELLVRGIDTAALWRYVVSGQHHLYRPKLIPQVGYRIAPRRKALAFEDLVRGTYIRPPEQRPTLLLEGDPEPARRVKRRVAGEQVYNAVLTGERSQRVLDRLEAVRLVFNVDFFKEDYRHAQRLVRWREKLPRARRAKYPKRQRAAARAKKMVERFSRVWERAQHLDGTVTIRSRFFRGINRRFHAQHFWPEHVSGKVDRDGSSPRERWFMFPTGALRGYDVMSSQTQILAILLGIRELERLASDPERPFKVYLAERLFEAYQRGELPTMRPVSGPAQLVPMMKTIWTRHLYGSRLQQIVRDNARDWLVVDPYTDDPASRARFTSTVIQLTRELEAFLTTLPWYAQIARWFAASQQIARIAQLGNPHGGATFVDPFSREVVRFNPTRRVRYAVRISRQTLPISLPGYWKDAAHSMFEPSPRVAGDYIVSGRKLRSSLAPMLIHMLDANLSAHLIEWLGSLDVPFVALHDAWLIPAGTMGAENQPLSNLIGVVATQEWFRDLGHLYDRLAEYLGNDPEHGEWVRSIRRQWQARLDAQDYPRIAVSPSR